MQTSKKTIYAHCDRRGVITISRKPEIGGLLCLGSGHGAAFGNMISALARHAYDGKTLLVSGVPEAENDDQALDAVMLFRLGILERQGKRKKTLAAVLDKFEKEGRA